MYWPVVLNHGVSYSQSTGAFANLLHFMFTLMGNKAGCVHALLGGQYPDATIRGSSPFSIAETIWESWTSSTCSCNYNMNSKRFVEGDLATCR